VDTISNVGSHIASTYLRLRRGMAVIALLFPPILLIGGIVIFGRAPQTSMSAYYHTEMQDVFVGVLCAIGAFLFLYKGFTWKEDIALNVAGVCAVGVALFAMDPKGDCAATASGFSIHGCFATAFFLAISYVCVFLFSDGPSSGIPEKLRARYVTIAKLCGTVMLVCIAAALTYAFLLPSSARTFVCGLNAIFWIEAFAVWAFSVFWLVKSLEYDHAISWLPWRRKAGT